MVIVPSDMVPYWNSAWQNLEPFEVYLICNYSDSNGSTTVEINKNSILGLIATRTLYGHASVGNCASSYIDLIIDNTFDLPYGTKITIFIYPRSYDDIHSMHTAGVPQGSFYITNIEKDTYTGVSKIQAVDALTYRENTFIQFPSDVYQSVTVGAVAAECATAMGIGIDTDLQLEDAATAYYAVQGYSCREILSLIGGSLARNITITHNNILKAVPLTYIFSRMLLGRRAERITYDGTWNGYHILLNDSEYKVDVSSQHVLVVRSASELSVPGDSEMTMKVTVLPGFSHNTSHYAEQLPIVSDFVIPYNAFTCDNIVFDPALELGDTVQVMGKYSSSLLSDTARQPLVWIEPGNDGTRIKVDQPHEHVPYWDNQQNQESIHGPITKLVVDYKTPQIAQVLQAAAPIS